MNTNRHSLAVQWESLRVAGGAGVAGSIGMRIAPPAQRGLRPGGDSGVRKSKEEKRKEGISNTSK